MSSVVIDKPTHDCLLELDTWCHKWAPIDKDARLKSVKISAGVNDVCMITCEMYAKEKEDE